MNHYDSTGMEIKVGDLVRWRGREYLVKSFPPGKTRRGAPRVEFTATPHTDREEPDEWAIDLVDRR